jgi:hypothetical protein
VRDSAALLLERATIAGDRRAPSGGHPLRERSQQLAYGHLMPTGGSGVAAG